MALTGKKYEKFYETTGSGSDKINSSKLTEVEAIWNADKAGGCAEYMNDPYLGPLLFQLQQMQDELDYLRTEISTNKDKTTFPGLGTSNSTALAGDTNIVTIGSSTTIAFGDMITTQPKGGKATYSIVMTVTNGGVSKAITLTLT